MKVEDMSEDELVRMLNMGWGMPTHYAHDWLNKADEVGMTRRQAVSALRFAMDLVGLDLDSWIYGDDMDNYFEMVVAS